MGVLDAVNRRWAMRLASAPVDAAWGMRREMMSQSFTTRVNELWAVIPSDSRPEARSYSKGML